MRSRPYSNVLQQQRSRHASTIRRIFRTGRYLDEDRPTFSQARWSVPTTSIPFRRTDFSLPRSNFFPSAHHREYRCQKAEGDSQALPLERDHQSSGVDWPHAPRPGCSPGQEPDREETTEERRHTELAWTLYSLAIQSNLLFFELLRGLGLA